MFSLILLCLVFIGITAASGHCVKSVIKTLFHGRLALINQAEKSLITSNTCSATHNLPLKTIMLSTNITMTASFGASWFPNWYTTMSKFSRIWYMRKKDGYFDFLFEQDTNCQVHYYLNLSFLINSSFIVTLPLVTCQQKISTLQR